MNIDGIEYNEEHVSDEIKALLTIRDRWEKEVSDLCSQREHIDLEIAKSHAAIRDVLRTIKSKLEKTDA